MKQSANDKIVIVAGGVTLDESLKAYDALAKEGIHVAVVDIFSIKPIDRETLSTQAKRVGGRVITVEDHYESGNLVSLCLVGTKSVHLLEFKKRIMIYF